MNFDFLSVLILNFFVILKYEKRKKKKTHLQYSVYGEFLDLLFK